MNNPISGPTFREAAKAAEEFWAAVAKVLEGSAQAPALSDCAIEQMVTQILLTTANWSAIRLNVYSGMRLEDLPPFEVVRQLIEMAGAPADYKERRDLPPVYYGLVLLGAQWARWRAGIDEWSKP